MQLQPLYAQPVHQAPRDCTDPDFPTTARLEGDTCPSQLSASILHAVFERELHGEGKERAYPTLLLDSTILFNTHVTSHLPPDTAEKLEQPSGGLSNPD